MIEGKVYALRMEIRTLAAQGLIQGRKYVVTIAKEGADRKIGPFQVTKKGQLTIGQKVQFKIPGSELRRESKCVIDVVEIQGKRQSKSLGKFEFLIMNYKNYSKNAFKFLDGQRTVGIIHMSINISSPQSQKYNERSENKPNLKPPKKQDKKVTIIESHIQSPVPLQSSLQVPPSINIKAPIEEIKLICPSETAPRQPKSMFGAFDNSSIVILTKRQVEAEHKRRSQTKPLSSMGELFQKKKEILAKEDSVLKLPNENLIKSCRLSPSRLHKDSRYCKEIQQNLDNLSALDQQSNRLSCSRSPLKGQQDCSIFDTLHRMKDKFQKIHEQEGFLNDQPLDELTQVNQEQTEQKDKLLQSENSNYYPIENLNRKIKSEYEPMAQLGRSTIINLEVHSAISHIQESDRDELSRCRIIKTVDLYCPPQRPCLRITACPNLQLSLNPSFDLHVPMRQVPLNKRYRLAMTTNTSSFEPREETQVLKQPPSLTQSYLNFQIQEESLQRVSYIKLNKITHLSKAADISKRRNNFLIKANEELKVAKRLAEQKLEVSKKIISEKEELLTHEFDALREHMRIISANLSLKNEQSIKREEKIKSLQGMAEQYVRDINSLKDDLRAKNATIKDLKALLSLKEEAESKSSKREEPSASRNIREAMFEQLGISKNIFDMLMEGGRQNELSISKNFREPPNFSKKEDASRRDGGLLAQIFTSQQRQNSFNKTFIQERKVRKYSSIQNTVNNIQQPGADKSADLSSRTFRKFSHSKNTSACIGEPQKKGGNANTNIDLVFEKLTGLFSGDSNSRILRNL